LLNNVIPFSLIFWGQGQLPAAVAAGLASILNATTPLFTVVVLHLFTSDEKATPRKVVAVLIGFLGVASMVGADAVSQLGASVVGQLACLGAALTYAFSGLYSRRFKTLGVSPPEIAFGQVTASTLMMLPLVAFVDQPWAGPAPGAIPLAAVVVMGLLSTALAYIVTFLIPVSGILLGWAVLGEALKPQHFVGMAAIGLSLALIDGRLFRRTGTP
jgi:drug/metabolite transporter (DMT)-like permease